MSNLPPGCSDSDIPGNRSEDEAWDRFYEQMSNSMSAAQATARWNSQPDLLAALEGVTEALPGDQLANILGLSLATETRAAIAKAKP